MSIQLLAVATNDVYFPMMYGFEELVLNEVNLEVETDIACHPFDEYIAPEVDAIVIDSKTARAGKISIFIYS